MRARTRHHTTISSQLLEAARKHAPLAHTWRVSRTRQVPYNTTHENSPTLGYDTTTNTETKDGMHTNTQQHMQ